MAYLPLSTANLPDPVIDPAQGASPEDYFGTLLYTGNNASDRTIAPNESGVTGNINFDPDFTWIMGRTAAVANVVYDSVRQAENLGLRLRPESADSESDLGDYVELVTNGFKVSGGIYNNDTAPFVAWNWKANGSGVSNTDGSITSTVSANTTSGFSIVSWTGTGANGSVGHGLDQSPEFIIAKNRDSTSAGINNWYVYHVSTGANGYLMLNQTDGVDSPNSTVWQGVTPTSSVFYVSTGGMNVSNDKEICYCFHSVEGFSKFGSYVGNGNADGPFVYTGFRPAFVMIKLSSGGGNWNVTDEKRNGYNSSVPILFANKSDAEYNYPNYHEIDILSNGFKVRNISTSSNTNGGTHIYMAFAENPFKYSNAR